MIDDIVECRTRKVTQYDMLVIRSLAHPLYRKEQWVVPITLKAISDGGYVYEIIRLYDYQTWNHLLACDSAIK